MMIFGVQFFKNHVLRPIKMIKKWPFLKGAHLAAENEQNLYFLDPDEKFLVPRKNLSDPEKVYFCFKK